MVLQNAIFGSYKCNWFSKGENGVNWIIHICTYRASLVTQTVKNLPAVWENQVRSLGQEDSLEKGIEIHSSSFAQRIPWTGEPGRLYVYLFSREQNYSIIFFICGVWESNYNSE